MQPVSPVFTGTLALELEKTFADEDGGKRYLPLSMFRTGCALVSRWRLTEEERKHIADGGDLFITVLSAQDIIHPMMPLACPQDEALQIISEVEQDAMK